MRVRPPPRRFTCLDLFAGAGGFSEGFRLAGFHTIAATDNDPWAGATYALNHNRHGAKFILGDITNRATKEELLSAAQGIDLDVVIGGPPCQAFSQVRNHHRVIDDPQNALYRHYVEVIARLRPRTFVMENVPGLENLAGGAVRKQILEDLALDGEYRVDCTVLDAAAFGVPQNRLRVLFIGVRSDLRVFPRFPEADYRVLPSLDRFRNAGQTAAWKYAHAKNIETNPALEELLDPKSTALVTVEQAIGDLAWLKPNSQLVRRPSDEPVSYELPASSAYQKQRRAGSRVRAPGDRDQLFRLIATGRSD